MTDTETNTITLISSDGKEFRVPFHIANKIGIVKVQLDDDDFSDFPLPCVDSVMLGHVLDFLKGSKEDFEIPKPIPSTTLSEFVPEWEAEFASQFYSDKEVRNSLIMACNFMDVPSLLHLLCALYSTEIRKMEPDDIIQLFKDVKAAHMEPPVSAEDEDMTA